MTRANIPPRGQLATRDAALGYIAAGHGRITLVSLRTGTRFTYGLSIARHTASPIFVKLLIGPDNEHSYSYLGCLWPQANGGLRWVHGRMLACASVDAPSARAMAWTIDRLTKGSMPADLEVWHEGVCGRCGRTLTVPESIEQGIGPVCAGKGAEA